MRKNNFQFATLLCVFVLLFLTLPFLLFGCASQSTLKNSYSISAQFDAQQNLLSCEEKVSYVNTSETALSEVCFFVYANVFAEGRKAVSTSYETKAYPNGESYGKLDFAAVCVSGQQADFSLDEEGRILTVALQKDLFPNETVCIEMTFTVTLANIRHRLGFGNNTVNFGNFFPIACVWENGFVKNEYAANGDPFYSDVSDFEVKILYPKTYTLACTGKAETTQNEENKTSICKAENVRDFCFVLSEKFSVCEAMAGNTLVSYYYYDDANFEDHLETSVKAVETFGEMFGQYPYETLCVVKADFCFGGMEYPNLVLIADDLPDADVDYVIVHEIAHQWWYGVVGNNEFENAWVDEGLTEFSCALFFQKHSEFGITYENIIAGATEEYQNFVKVYANILGEVDESMNRNLNQFSTEPEYVNCTYTKGMLLFDAVRSSMSDRKFFNCLKTYFKTYKFKNSSAEKLVESFSKTSGMKLERFFDCWVSGEVKIGA